MLQACRITGINQRTYAEERHPLLSVLPLASSHGAAWPAAELLGTWTTGNRICPLEDDSWQTGARWLAGVCTSAQICSVSSQPLPLSQVENRVTYPKRKALRGVVASPPVRGTLILSASFMFSPPSFVTPVFFPLSFLLSGYAVKGLKIFWGRVLPLSCSVRGITGVSGSLCDLVWLCHSFKQYRNCLAWQTGAVSAVVLMKNCSWGCFHQGFWG